MDDRAMRALPVLMPEPMGDAMSEGLVWLANVAIGFCAAPVPPDLYGKKYWNEYRRRDATEMGRLLTEARMKFVLRFVPHVHLDCFVDIGVGGGRFVSETGVHGYDINPFALDWLTQEGRFVDATREPHDVMSFWDSLEHDVDWRLLANCRQWAFVSTPIYLSCEDCLRSKHYKPDGEHRLYFTNNGLIWFMRQHGFEMVAYDNFEVKLGREAIGTYAFRRTKKGPE